MSKNAVPQVAANSIESLAAPYLLGKKKFNELNLRTLQGVEVAKYCLSHNNAFIKELDPKNPTHISLLQSWITPSVQYPNALGNYKIISKYIKSTALLDHYLYLKFGQSKSEQKDVSILKSFNNNIVIGYRYKTRKGETLAYFDKALGVPTVLTIAADLKVKIINSQKLVESIDINTMSVDLRITVEFIDNKVSKVLRDSLLGFLKAHELSYYELSQYYSLISEQAISTLNKDFEEAGLLVSYLNIIDITIPNNTNEMFERQYFALAEEERVKDFEFRMEKESLDLYERKAEIHSKYPEFPITLTESEKDFALNRYLKRVGRYKELTADIQSDELAEKGKQATGTFTKTNKEKVVEPEAPSMPRSVNAFRVTWIVLLIVALIVSSILFVVSVGAALIAYGVTILIFGILLAVKLGTFKAGKQAAQAYKEYDKQTEIYNNESAAYLENEIDKKVNK